MGNLPPRGPDPFNTYKLIFNKKKQTCGCVMKTQN